MPSFFFIILSPSPKSCTCWVHRHVSHLPSYRILIAFCVPHSRQSSTSTFPMTVHGSRHPCLSPLAALVLGVQSSLVLHSWPQLLAALLLPGRFSHHICTVRLTQMLDSPWLIGMATICLLHPVLTKANRRLGTSQKYTLALSIWSAQVQVLYPGPDYWGLLPRNPGLG